MRGAAALFADGLEWYLFAFVHNATGSEFLEMPLQKACPELRSFYLNESFICVLINVDLQEGEKLRDYLQINFEPQKDRGMLQALRLRDSGSMSKFSPKKEASAAFDARSIVSFATGVLRGKAARRLRSEPLPDPRDPSVRNAAVVKTVAATFNQTVEGMQDMLMAFYAPWCPFSQKLLPRLERLAWGLRESGIFTVGIGKLDLTKNDLPFEVERFPTLILWKSVRDEEARRAVEFTGLERDRTEEVIMKFIEENIPGVELTAEAWNRIRETRKIEDAVQ